MELETFYQTQIFKRTFSVIVVLLFELNRFSAE